MHPSPENAPLPMTKCTPPLTTGCICIQISVICHIIRTLIWIESESLFFTNLRVTTLKCGIIQLLAYENIYRVFGRTEYRGLLILSARDYYNAFFGQFFTHSIHSMHSVPLLRFRELSVISTFIGQRRLHLPHDMHLLLLHVTRTSEK